MMPLPTAQVPPEGARQGSGAVSEVLAGFVLVLAGKWSFDPTAIEVRFTEPSTGWVGRW